MKKVILLTALLATGAQGSDFAFTLYGQLSEAPGNLFFSPASIEAALAMTAVSSDSACRVAKQARIGAPSLSTRGLGSPPLTTRIG